MKTDDFYFLPEDFPDDFSVCGREGDLDWIGIELIELFRIEGKVVVVVVVVTE